jgi:glutathione S-transferase
LITVHHLDHSRSLRILWLLEELGLPYELVEHRRDPATRLAPPSLEAVHPLGKAPLVVDDGRILFESGAIIDYLIRHYGEGRLAPPPESAEYDDYQMWLHYAEGSAMLPMMLNLYTSRLGEGAAPLRGRIDSELARHLGFVEQSLAGRDYLVGDGLTGADIQFGFVAEMLAMTGQANAYPNIAAWLARLQERPAYQRAVEKGGANALTPTRRA